MSAFSTAEEHEEEFTPSPLSSDLFPGGLLQLMTALAGETQTVWTRDNLTFGILARHSPVVSPSTGTLFFKDAPQLHFSRLENCTGKTSQPSSFERNGCVSRQHDQWSYDCHQLVAQMKASGTTTHVITWVQPRSSDERIHTTVWHRPGDPLEFSVWADCFAKVLKSESMQQLSIGASTKPSWWSKHWIMDRGCSSSGLESDLRPVLSSRFLKLDFMSGWSSIEDEWITHLQLIKESMGKPCSALGCQSL